MNPVDHPMSLVEAFFLCRVFRPSGLPLGDAGRPEDPAQEESIHQAHRARAQAGESHAVARYPLAAIRYPQSVIRG